MDADDRRQLRELALRVVVRLTPEQIRSLPASPVTVLPAPGDGKRYRIAADGSVTIEAAARRHQCKPAAPHCTCYLGADAPDDDCPIHAGGIVNRCECGRFVSLRRP